MAAITLIQAQQHLQIWLEAEEAVATSQSYRIGTRSLTRADLKEIRNQIIFWKGLIDQLQRKGRNRVKRAVPRDL
jgi:putative hemolysin